MMDPPEISIAEILLFQQKEITKGLILINWDMQTFFLRLKLNLTEKMERCRPQFFLKERSDDLANMKVYFFCIKCVCSV